MASLSSPQVLPQWLQSAKDDILCTSEWKQLARELHTRVVAELPMYITDTHAKRWEGGKRSDRSGTFAELRLDEQKALVEDVFDRYIERGAMEGMYKSHFLPSLQSKLEEAVLKRSTTGRPIIGCIEDIRAAVSEGTVAVLNTLSMADKRSVMQLVLNVELPKHLRGHVWATYLRDEKSRQEFLNRRERWIDTVSKFDVKITQDLERLIKASRYAEIITPSRIMLLKSVISFHTVLLGDETCPDTSTYWMGLPLLSAYLEDPSINNENAGMRYGTMTNEDSSSVQQDRPPVGREGPMLHSMARLFESFRALSLEALQVANDLADPSSSDVLGLLRTQLAKYDPELLESISKLQGTGGSGLSKQGDAKVATEMLRLLRTLFGRSLACGLADILSIETTAFVWDSCVTTSFLQVLPYFLFCLLHVLRDSLVASGDAEDLRRILEHKAPFVRVCQLQQALNEYCMADIRTKLRLLDPSPFLQVSFGVQDKSAKMVDGVLSSGLSSGLTTADNSKTRRKTSALKRASAHLPDHTVDVGPATTTRPDISFGTAFTIPATATRATGMQGTADSLANSATVSALGTPRNTANLAETISPPMPREMQQTDTGSGQDTLSRPSQERTLEPLMSVALLPAPSAQAPSVVAQAKVPSDEKHAVTQAAGPKQSSAKITEKPSPTKPSSGLFGSLANLTRMMRNNNSPPKAPTASAAQAPSLSAVPPPSDAVRAPASNTEPAPTVAPEKLGKKPVEAPSVSIPDVPQSAQAAQQAGEFAPLGTATANTSKTPDSSARRATPSRRESGRGTPSDEAVGREAGGRRQVRTPSPEASRRRPSRSPSPETERKESTRASVAGRRESATRTPSPEARKKQSAADVRAQPDTEGKVITPQRALPAGPSGPKPQQATGSNRRRENADPGDTQAHDVHARPTTGQSPDVSRRPSRAHDHQPRRASRPPSSAGGEHVTTPPGHEDAALAEPRRRPSQHKPSRSGAEVSPPAMKSGRPPTSEQQPGASMHDGMGGKVQAPLQGVASNRSAPAAGDMPSNSTKDSSKGKRGWGLLGK